MTNKELKQRLSELVMAARAPLTSNPIAEKIADHLIANGVTIRERGEWIPVTERLPEETCECLGVDKIGTMYLMPYSSRYRAFNATDDDEGDRWKLNDITHWMPLPLPPEADMRGVKDE